MRLRRWVISSGGDTSIRVPARRESPRLVWSLFTARRALLRASPGVALHLAGFEGPIVGGGFVVQQFLGGEVEGNFGFGGLG